MRILKKLVIAAAFVVLSSASVFAQVQTKIAVINTQAFAATKGGITKYVNAQNRLNAEFKVTNNQLTALATRINNLKKEINTLQNNASKNAPIGKSTINAKISQHNDLTREMKFKQEDAKAKYEKRSGEVLGPVTQDIFKALQVYSTQKGYSMIFDASQLDRAGLVLAFDRKFDVTADFITYYNARPAGTATK